jgi:hypothetical protein
VAAFDKLRPIGLGDAMLRQAAILTSLVALPSPAAAQELPDEGQSEAAYRAFLVAKPHVAAEVAAFEAWLARKSVADALPSWQILRTASMWRVCNGPPFEVPPRKLWPNVARTLRFVRDQVRPALGPVEAVSGYRNAALNICARGAATSAHRDYSALDLVPAKALTRRQIFDRMCLLHRRKGEAAGVGLGFYAFTRFHIDTRSFRRWGAAGAMGNESPCAVIERGGDPEAPPVAVEPPPPAPAVVQPHPPLAEAPPPDPARPKPAASRKVNRLD